MFLLVEGRSAEDEVGQTASRAGGSDPGRPSLPVIPRRSYRGWEFPRGPELPRGRDAGKPKRGGHLDAGTI